MFGKLVPVIVVSLLVSGYTAHADVDVAVPCKEKKAKAIGKKAVGLLEAFGKNIEREDPARLDSAISKANSKFTKGFTEAEARGRCITSGDSDAIEAKVDAFVLDVVEEVSRVATTTVTTTSLFAPTTSSTLPPTTTTLPATTTTVPTSTTMTEPPTTTFQPPATTTTTMPGACGPCVSDDGCPPGTVCNASQLCLPWCECPLCDVCAGLCVPRECGDCTSNVDCAPGTTCNAAEVCLVSCSCPFFTVCAGTCVP